MVDSNFKEISDESLRSYVKSQIDRGHALSVIREFLISQNIDPIQVSRVLGSFNLSVGLTNFDNTSHHESFFSHHKLLVFAGIFLISIFVVFLFLNSLGQESSFSDEVSLSVLESDISSVLGLDSNYISLSNVSYSSKGSNLFFSVDKNIDSGILSQADLFLYLSNDDESVSLMLSVDDSFNLNDGRFKFDSIYLKAYPDLNFSVFTNAQLVVRPKPIKNNNDYVNSLDSNNLENNSFDDNSFIENNSKTPSPSLGGSLSTSSGGGSTSPSSNDDPVVSNDSIEDSFVSVNISFSFDSLSDGVFKDSSSLYSAYYYPNYSLVSSINGNGLNFSKDSYLSINDSGVFDDSLSALTISAWVKPANENDSYQGIVMHGGPAVDTYALYLKNNENLIAFKSDGTNNSWSTVTLNQSIVDCNWHHIVLTYDGAQKRIYFDGSLIFNVSDTGNISSGDTYRLMFGAGRDTLEPGLPYNGLLDDVFISNYAISSDLVSSWYSTYTPSSCVEPVDLVIDTCPSGATCYYVANNGSDSDTGLSKNTPWKTISKVNSVTLSPGDYVLFRRGDTWNETLNITDSGTSLDYIHYSSYGVDSYDKPLITGFTTVDSWTNLGGNIWESSNTVSGLDTLNMVVIDGVNTPRGRFPNIDDESLDYGFLHSVSPTDKISLSAAALSSSPNWSGAEAVIRTLRYAWERKTILTHVGDTIDLVSATASGPVSNGGFFIQNSPLTLDRQNEWYYNSSSKKIQIYSSSSPIDVKLSSKEYLVDVNANYFVIDNLSFSGSNNYAVYMPVYSSSTRNGIIVTNSDFNFLGFGGFYVRARSLVIENNTINNSQTMALFAYLPEDAIIRNNYIENSGNLHGMGRGEGSGIWAAINVGDSINTTIENNVLKNIGYNAISGNAKSFSSPLIIRNNYIDTFCFILDDGGGIYLMEDANAKIYGNVILNGLGANNGSSSASKEGGWGVGIYLDRNSHNVEIENNTIYNMAQYGVLMNNPTNTTLLNNLIYDSGAQFRIYNDGSPYVVSTNNLVQNNIFVSSMSQQVANIQSKYNDGYSFLTSDYNYFARPIDDDYIIYYSLPATGGNTGTLEEWQAASGHDANSHKSPINISSASDILFDYNVGLTDKVVPLIGSYVNISGNSVSGSITIPPYSGVILLKN